jgi:hypothetical protein
MRPAALAASVLLAAVAGIASASVVSPGSAAEQPAGGRDEMPARSIQTGEPVADPRGGSPWAVRIYNGDSAWRCIDAGRTDGQAFGPVDASGDIHDTGRVASGSCADPAQDRLQLGLAYYADTAGTGPRRVLFGVAGDDVVSVELVVAGVRRPIVLDATRTFVVPSDDVAGLENPTVTITLSDGTLRAYQL